MSKPRYIMIGGFLGAGKTTTLLRLATRLSGAGARVGLITNDQSTGLADTALLASHGFAVEEITGGCFCCRFGSLVNAAEHLTRATAPDVFVAEPVGSCTDLKATVSYPLRRIYGDAFTVAPFSVLVDPARALRILGLEPGRPFSPKVSYVYAKQLEEADAIAVNKVDAVSAERIDALEAALAVRFPRARIFRVSARENAGLDPWFDFLCREQDHGSSNLDIDYDTYAEGEALLGWLNVTATVDGPPFDGNAWIRGLAAALQSRLAARGVEIAHLKMTLSPADEGTDLAVLNTVGSDARIDMSHHLQDSVSAAELVLNLRAEGDPDVLQAEALETLNAACRGLRLSVDHLEGFRPGRPVPTHREVLA